MLTIMLAAMVTTILATEFFPCHFSQYADGTSTQSMNILQAQLRDPKVDTGELQLKES
jgi:hypothetical protein